MNENKPIMIAFSKDDEYVTVEGKGLYKRVKYAKQKGVKTIKVPKFKIIKIECHAPQESAEGKENEL